MIKHLALSAFWLVVLSLSVYLATSWRSIFQNQTNAVADIVSARGNIYVKEQEIGIWEPGFQGQALVEGASVSLNQASTLQIRFRSGYLIDVTPGSQFTIKTELTSDGSFPVIVLDSGSVDVRSESPNQKRSKKPMAIFSGKSVFTISDKDRITVTKSTSDATPVVEVEKGEIKLEGYARLKSDKSFAVIDNTFIKPQFESLKPTKTVAGLSNLIPATTEQTNIDLEKVPNKIETLPKLDKLKLNIKPKGLALTAKNFGAVRLPEDRIYWTLGSLRQNAVSPLAIEYQVENEVEQDGEVSLESKPGLKIPLKISTKGSKLFYVSKDSLTGAFPFERSTNGSAQILPLNIREAGGNIRQKLFSVADWPKIHTYIRLSTLRPADVNGSKWYPGRILSASESATELFLDPKVSLDEAAVLLPNASGFSIGEGVASTGKQGLHIVRSNAIVASMFDATDDTRLKKYATMLRKTIKGDWYFIGPKSALLGTWSNQSEAEAVLRKLGSARAKALLKDGSFFPISGGFLQQSRRLNDFVKSNGVAIFSDLQNIEVQMP